MQLIENKESRQKEFLVHATTPKALGWLGLTLVLTVDTKSRVTRWDTEPA
jgi:hypothetical protein